MLGMDPAARQLVVAIVQEHADSLLRVARRYTDCAADAEDAYQRTMEIFVRNAGRLDPDTAYKWVHTVCKHEVVAGVHAASSSEGCGRLVHLTCARLARECQAHWDVLSCRDARGRNGRFCSPAGGRD